MVLSCFVVSEGFVVIFDFYFLLKKELRWVGIRREFGRTWRRGRM